MTQPKHADLPLVPNALPPITFRILACFVLLALAAFAPAFFPWQQIAGTDYVTGGFYFLEFAARTIRAGHLPGWVPYVFGGVPMYANPGSLFYPTRLLFSEVLPIERVMPALYVVQFALAGIGMHLFGRALGARPWVAFLGGLLYEFTGITFSFVYAGHDGRIIVATLAPLLFYFVTLAIRTGHLCWFAGIAATVGLILLSFQLQGAYYVLLGAGAWAVFLLVRARPTTVAPVLLRRAALGTAAVAFGFTLASVNLLPFSGYVEDSPRSSVAHRDFAFSTQFSMPLVETVGFAVPEQAGILEEYKGDNAFKLHTEYVGAIVLLLLVVGAMSFQRDATWQFMAGLSLFMLTICYGSYTPLYALYYRFLPGTPKFRSPSIALFMVSFALVTMAVLTLETLADALDHRDVKRAVNVIPRRLFSFFIVASVLIITIALGTALDGGHKALGWARFGICLLLGALIFRAWIFGRIQTRTASMLLCVLAVADLWMVDRHFLWTQPESEIVYAADDVVKFLQTQPEGRVWVFPFPNAAGSEHYMGNKRFPPNSDYLMHFGIVQAGGEHGNQPFRWNRLAGIGATGNVDWHNFVEYPAMLAAAGVKYVVSGVSLSMVDGKSRMGMKNLRELYHGTAYVYEYEGAVPRAVLVPSVLPVATPQLAVIAMRNAGWDARRLAVVEGVLPELADSTIADTSPGTVRVVSDAPERVTLHVDAERPALLVLSDNYIDGWTARVDGREVPILHTNLAFRGVLVTGGTHDVLFEFAAPRLHAGLWISMAGWTVLLIAATFFLVRARRRQRVFA